MRTGLKRGKNSHSSVERSKKQFFFSHVNATGTEENSYWTNGDISKRLEGEPELVLKGGTQILMGPKGGDLDCGFGSGEGRTGARTDRFIQEEHDG